MRPNDPDDQPTRAGGNPPERPDDRDEQNTVPSFDGKNDGKTDGKKDERKDDTPAAGGKPPSSTKPWGRAGADAAGKPPSEPAKPSAAPRPAAVPNDPLLGRELGGCRLDKLLGRGAMGAVYKARQLKLDRDVAIKIIRPEMMTDPRMLKRFEVEARTVGKFNSAHVVMVHDVGFQLSVHFLVMEFVEGKNLRDHVKLLAGGRLPAGEALPLLRQAIRGLEEAQRLQVVHRDIKPDNLMLTDRGILKIADFGIAKPLQEDFSMTLTSELVGTPLYMSPEQCQGEANLDFRSDMYSLGATFYYLLTGEPPIRASSVYELIQTKTKMANLCLWKALPGLDENNPLSRVIERMTALSRDDRYPSYEALLNDLVLVEQGATITLPKTGAGRARAGATDGSKKGLWAAVAAVLLAGGGFGAWKAFGGEPEVVVAPVADVAARLVQLRAQCKESGPTATMQKELRALPASVERDQLLADVDESLRIKGKLDAIVLPKELALPLTDVRTHLAAVEAASASTRPNGPEVRVWIARWREAARAENQLAAMATKALTVAFARWQDDRSKFAGDQQQLAALTERLTAIEAARRELLDALPAVRDSLAQDLPGERLDAARQGLAEPGKPTMVDASDALAAIATELQQKGPEAALEQRLRELQPTQAEQVTKRDELLNAYQKAQTQRTLVLQAKTANAGREVQPPFDDVRQYFDQVDAGLAPLRQDGKLPAWAEALRTEARDEARLGSAVTAACAAAFARWQQKAADAPTPAQLRAMQKQASELFPAAAAAIAAAIPATALAADEAKVQRGAAMQTWQADAGKAETMLDGLKNLAEWRAKAARCGEQLAALEKAAAAFAGEPEVATVLQRVKERSDRWRAADVALVAMAKDFGAGALTKVEAALQVGLPGSEGAVELEALGVAARACREAFDGLGSRLDTAAAKSAFGKARTAVQGFVAVLPDVEARLRKWSEGLDALQRAAAGMVPIAAGGLRNPPASVDAFFVAATECSRAEFVAFQTELRAAVAGKASPADRLASVAQRLVGSGMTTERLQDLLDFEPSRGGDRTPVHRVTWFAAAACAAWSGRALPTHAEWALAAFGDNNANEFPWGAGWASSSDKRNISDDVVEVDAGGNSWRVANGTKLHHLAGNVAEWLAADAAAPQASLAGGRFSDREASAKEQARGGLINAAKDDGQKGFGFRTVLRPRQFAPLQWPQ